MNYEFNFVPAGSTKENRSALNNEIWLDVGNQIGIGAFDHHNQDPEAEEKYGSTVDIIFKNLQLLEETYNQVDKNLPVVFYLHYGPDTDALFAVYIVEEYINLGKDAFEKKYLQSGLKDIIVSYVNDIDEGKNKVVDKKSLYSLICFSDHNLVKALIPSGKSEIDICLEWIDEFVSSVATGSIKDIYGDEINFKGRPEIIEVVKQAIDESLDAYNKDKTSGNLNIKNIPIWTTDGQIEEVRAAIWKDVPSSPNTCFVFARDKDLVDLTFIPKRDLEKHSVFISINPNKKNSVGHYSLKAVAEMYEQLEQIYEKKLYEETGELNRDYSESRGYGSSFFANKPFSLTKDPWYIRDTEDVVDAPGAKGTLIPIEVLGEVLENITKMVKSSYSIKYDLSLENDAEEITPTIKSPVVRSDSKVYTSMMDWIKKTSQEIKTLSNSKVYPLIIAEVDAALIAHNYNILDAYYMSLTDGAYIDADESNVFRIDYRTHLYVNQSNAVLFVATSDNRREENSLKELLNLDNIENSSLLTIFSKILYQREKYKNLGLFLSDFEKNQKGLSKKNEELIQILAKAQGDECIDTQLEWDIYHFVYKALNIQGLKNDVKETMALVSDYIQDKAYGSLNTLSIIAIPFLLLSTIFQIGIIEIKPLASVSDGLTTVAWLGFILIISLITYILVKKK